MRAYVSFWPAGIWEIERTGPSDLPIGWPSTPQKREAAFWKRAGTPALSASEAVRAVLDQHAHGDRGWRLTAEGRAKLEKVLEWLERGKG